MQARADLHRRQISQQGSDAVSDADQKEALREAQKRLRVAEEKVALVKRLIPQLHHAIDEYHSHSQPLGDHLSGGFEKSMAALEKMILALESYLALRAPTAPVFETAAETGPTSAGSSTTTRRGRRQPAAKPLPPNGETKTEPTGIGAGRSDGAAGFREDIMSAHSGRLQHALKHIREQWDIAQETWDDPVSRDFERIHLMPLEQLTKDAITGMEKVSEVAGKDPGSVQGRLIETAALACGRPIDESLDDRIGRTSVRQPSITDQGTCLSRHSFKKRPLRSPTWKP